MTTDRLFSRIRNHPARWRLLGLGLILGALAASSFVPDLGPRPSVADSLNVDLEEAAEGNKLWAAVSHDADGYREVTFEHFNDFLYQPPGGAQIDYMTPAVPEELGRPYEERVPERIRELDGKKIAVAGFIMPFAGKPDAMTQFALVRNIMICCYGVAPLMTEWILVEASPEQKLRYHRNIPVLLRGVLEIDESVEQGFVVSLLEMNADDLLLLDRTEFKEYYERTGAL